MFYCLFKAFTGQAPAGNCDLFTPCECCFRSSARDLRLVPKSWFLRDTNQGSAVHAPYLYLTPTQCLLKSLLQNLFLSQDFVLTDGLLVFGLCISSCFWQSYFDLVFYCKAICTCVFEKLLFHGAWKPAWANSSRSENQSWNSITLKQDLCLNIAACVIELLKHQI